MARHPRGPSLPRIAAAPQRPIIGPAPVLLARCAFVVVRAMSAARKGEPDSC